jgi:cytochrome P450
MGDEISQVGQAVDMGGALLERPNSPQFRAAIQTIENIVQRVIANRRELTNEAARSRDLLGNLMHAQDQDTGLVFDDTGLRNQVITLLLAGYETTASALTWTFYLLSQNPDIITRLRQELGRTLNGRAPNYTDLPALEYTRMVFEESLRLRPPAWVMGRVALGDDQLDGYFVPAGTIIAISPYTVHRHPGFWDDPERFDPERFMPERSAGRHRFAYIPFGAGPRQCIGNSFAMLEAALIISMVVQGFDLSLVPDHEIKPEVVFVLRPDRLMKMALSLAQVR